MKKVDTGKVEDQSKAQIEKASDKELDTKDTDGAGAYSISTGTDLDSYPGTEPKDKKFEGQDEYISPQQPNRKSDL
ncbi:MAG: hypothetical protein H7Y03_07115 [Chitinophagaceae bacterium]|nr:hypothetical protein [Chitinophagaceae bacterium]